VKANRSLEEETLFFAMVRIGYAALYGANGLTSFVIVESDALGAELGIDDVDLIPLADGFVGAFGLARTAVDTIGRNMSGHGDFGPERR